MFDFIIFFDYFLNVKRFNEMKSKKIQEENLFEPLYPRVILGLDVSTSCIGISIVEDDGSDNPPKIIAITHKSPKVSKKIKGVEALFMRKKIFEEGFIKKISEYTNKKITDVIIEEPLISSNNAYTVAALLRFNGMIADSVYNVLGVIPHFISSYDARTYSFPELVSLRKYNKKGVEYPLKHVQQAIRKDNIVLFGSYPFDIDKKNVMMNMVDSLYTDENAIPWELDKHGEIKKENYDACDSLICALAYININHHGIEKPTIVDYEKKETKDKIIIEYTTSIWNKKYHKTLELPKE